MRPSARGPSTTSVMIEERADARCMLESEVLDLNHDSTSMMLVSFLIPEFARDAGTGVWRALESGY